MNKSIAISFISISAITLGFTAIHKGHLEIGMTLATTVVSGYFGYSTNNDSNLKPEIVFLLSIMLGAYILLMYSSSEAFTTSISIVTSAVGGYFGYLQQDRIPPKTKPRTKSKSEIINQNEGDSV